MRTCRYLVWVWATVVAAFAMYGQDKTEGGWSAELLSRILKADPAPAEATAAPVSGEKVLRTYRLTHLRIGEAGKSQNTVAILTKLLPPGSTVNSDVPANSLHVLTTPAAHQGVWDLLSAVDSVEPVPAAAPAVVPEDVRLAIRKIAESGEQSTRVLAAVDGLKSDVTRELAEIDARQRRQTLRFALIGLAFGLVLTGTLAWMLRRRSAGTGSAQATTALALAPEQLATALNPVHDKVRNDMLGLLNEVAIKLQAQHHEQQQRLEDTRLALATERKQFIAEAGTMVVQAVERVDATTAKLAKQQDKVAELVEELQGTVRELDETKDTLRRKQSELERERAKIAALSLLLEEGGTLPPADPFSANGHNGHALPDEPATAVEPSPSDSPSLPSAELSFPPCTIPVTPSVTEPNPPLARFTFLPPDHPEN